MTTDTPAILTPADDAAPAPAPVWRPVPWVEVWVASVAVAAAAATLVLVVRGGQPAAAGWFVPALCLVVVALAAGFDAATSRIPFQLTYTAALLGLALNCLAVPLKALAPNVAAHWLGAAGPAQSLYGLLLFGGIGLVCLAVAGMGGGDMKLLAAVGGLLGVSRATDALVCALAVAVVYALVNLAIAGRLNATIRAIAVQALNMVYLRDLSPTVAVSRRTIPLAVPIFVGVVLSHLPAVRGLAGWLRGA